MTLAFRSTTAPPTVRRPGFAASLLAARVRRRCPGALAAGLLLASAAGVRTAMAAPATDGTWTAAPTNPGVGQAFGLWLLTDGTVLSHGQVLNNWVVLVPDAKGSYANGTWKAVASSVHARGGAQQHVLRTVASSRPAASTSTAPTAPTALCPTTEIYDPVANTWTPEATAPYDIGDTGSATLADGRILDSTRSNTDIQIYDPGREQVDGLAAPCRCRTGTRTPGPRCRTGACSPWATRPTAPPSTTPPPASGSAPVPCPAASTPATPAASRRCSTGASSSTASRARATSTRREPPPPTRGRGSLGPKMLNGDEAEDEFSDTLAQWQGVGRPGRR